MLENETHFLISCPIDHEERQTLITQVSSLYPQFLDMDEQHAFLFLITNEDPNILTWTGKFIYSAFVKRRSLNIDMTESTDGTPPNVACRHGTRPASIDLLLRQTCQAIEEHMQMRILCDICLYRFLNTYMHMLHRQNWLLCLCGSKCLHDFITKIWNVLCLIPLI